jgi:hypothetical protein
MKHPAETKIEQVIVSLRGSRAIIALGQLTYLGKRAGVVRPRRTHHFGACSGTKFSFTAVLRLGSRRHESVYVVESYERENCSLRVPPLICL